MRRFGTLVLLAPDMHDVLGHHLYAFLGRHVVVSGMLEHNESALDFAEIELVVDKVNISGKTP